MPQRAGGRGATVERVAVRRVEEGVFRPVKDDIVIVGMPEGNVRQFVAQDLVSGARYGTGIEGVAADGGEITLGAGGFTALLASYWRQLAPLRTPAVAPRSGHGVTSNSAPSGGIAIGIDRAARRRPRSRFTLRSSSPSR